MKIDFEFDTPHGKFKDALNLPDDHNFSDEEIQTMKEQRRDNWIAAVLAPPQEDTMIEIEGETYDILEGVPEPGAILKEVDGTWYYKV